MTSPPRPPSPPSGPPRGTNFSRLKLTAPDPPAPERTRIATSSRNTAGPALGQGFGGRLGRLAGGFSAGRDRRQDFSGRQVDAHTLASGAEFCEVDGAIDQRKKRGVPAQAAVPARNDSGARWGNVILPPRPRSPPKRLTPSRWELESRPLRELPPPFLCATVYSFPFGLAAGFLV